jgi:hypothetical protein
VLSTQNLRRSNRELARVKNELAALQPLTLAEVARQLEEQTKSILKTIEVIDVRYSRDENAYHVTFSFEDSKAGGKWKTSVILKGDGFGRWSGSIRSDGFLAAAGNPGGSSYPVLVKTEDWEKNRAK